MYGYKTTPGKIAKDKAIEIQFMEVKTNSPPAKFKNKNPPAYFKFKVPAASGLSFVLSTFFYNFSLKKLLNL